MRGRGHGSGQNLGFFSPKGALLGGGPGGLERGAEGNTPVPAELTADPRTRRPGTASRAGRPPICSSLSKEPSSAYAEALGKVTMLPGKWCPPNLPTWDAMATWMVQQCQQGGS